MTMKLKDIRWNAFLELDTYKWAATELPKRAMSETGKFVETKALPAIGYGLEWTVAHADQACGAAVRKEVELLQRYPNFTMLVSQSTVFRMAAAEHYKNATGKNTTSASEIVTTTM
jgi:hypothetical protein